MEDSPGGRGSHDEGAGGGDQSPPSSVREQDRFLPIANIGRIMKKSLPANGKIAKDAKDVVQECVSEFISFVTSEYDLILLFHNHFILFIEFLILGLFLLSMDVLFSVFIGVFVFAFSIELIEFMCFLILVLLVICSSCLN